VRRTRPHPTAPRPRRPAAAGSAYVIVLLILVVLTILGLSLALVTQTERQIGTSEKTVQRVFASAETGIALAVAKALVLPDYQGMNLQFQEPRTRLDGTADPALGAASLLQRHDVAVSVMMPLLDAPCNLCQINRGGSSDSEYKEFNFGLVSTATRRGWTGSDATQAAVLGRQSVSTMIEIQPMTGDQTTPASDATWSDARTSSGREDIGNNPF
jgi:hypothetical protein